MSSKSRLLVAIARWGKVFDLNWHDLSKHIKTYNFIQQKSTTWFHRGTGWLLPRWIPLHPLLAASLGKYALGGGSGKTHVAMHSKFQAESTRCYLSSVWWYVSVCYCSKVQLHAISNWSIWFPFSESGIFENVPGIHRVMDKILPVLASHLPECLALSLVWNWCGFLQRPLES